MFKNSDSDSDAEVGRTRSGRSFREVPMLNLFEDDPEPLAQDEGFYSGEEEDLVNEEHLESVRAEERKNEGLCRDESGASGIAPSVKVSTITPPIIVETISNQSNLRYQSTQSTATSKSVPIQLGSLGKSMADEMRFPTFRDDGSEDPDHHLFL
jgi:hypothetical protein